MIQVPSGGNNGVKKLDGGLGGDFERGQRVDGSAFSGEQVHGQRNGAFVDGAGKSKREERAVELESARYFGRGVIPDAVGD